MKGKKQICRLLILAMLSLGGLACSTQTELWISIGPAPIEGGPASGRIASIAVDRTNSNHWLIGAAEGGVWATFNAGTSWVPLTDNQASLAMGAIAFAPSRPNIIYVGTGDRLQVDGAYAGAGLLKSTDSGKTWQLLAASTFARSSFSENHCRSHQPRHFVSNHLSRFCRARSLAAAVHSTEGNFQVHRWRGNLVTEGADAIG
jgi:hypothetical protein